MTDRDSETSVTPAGVRADIRMQFSDEQAQLQDMAVRFCREQLPISTTRQKMGPDSAFDAALWRQMTELGWSGIRIPEAEGGVGMEIGDVATVAEALGEVLAPANLLHNSLVAGAVLQATHAARKAEWLAALNEGAVAAIAFSEWHGDWDLTHLTCQAEQTASEIRLKGGKCLVNDGDVADLVLVSVMLDGTPALLLAPGTAFPDSCWQRETVIDETQRMFKLTLDNVTLPADCLLAENAGDILAKLESEACLLLAADMCGALKGTLNMVVDYLSTRRQFGRIIGGYQALKHPTVDMLTALDAARSHLFHAATVATDPLHGEIAARMAKATAGDGLAFAADRAIQFHGGFGFTYDCDAQLFRRRGLWGEARFGDAAYQRRMLADKLFKEVAA